MTAHNAALDEMLHAMTINLKRGTLDRLMHQLKPSDHAAMGWAHGQYKDGYCFALMASSAPDDVAAFKADAESRGAVYVDLIKIGANNAQTRD